MIIPTPDEICERLRLHRYALPDGFYSDEDYGCNADDPCSLIMSILDSGPQGEKVMQELTACGYSIVKTEDTDNAADLIQQQLAEIERLSAALDWAETYDPQLVAQIYERAALRKGASYE